MADISNSKINERENVERPNLWESLRSKMKFIWKGKIKIGKIANGVNGRIIPKFANFWNFGRKFKFQKYLIQKIPKTSNLEI